MTGFKMEKYPIFLTPQLLPSSNNFNCLIVQRCSRKDLKNRGRHPSGYLGDFPVSILVIIPGTSLDVIAYMVSIKLGCDIVATE